MKRHLSAMRRGLLASAIAACATAASAAPTLSIVYQFGGGLDGNSAAETALTSDADGNLIGVTDQGGEYDAGTMFKLDRAGRETQLHVFSPPLGEGMNPGSTPVLDAQGNRYGTTFNGGVYGFGTVYKLDAKGKLTVLHSFRGGAGDGRYPTALVRDADGNLFGTTYWGGRGDCYLPGGLGCGLVWKIDTRGKYHKVYQFRGVSDGAFPGSLIIDSAGNLIGATNSGGRYASDADYFGPGTLFRIAPDGTKTTIHDFDGVHDGYGPRGAIAADRHGAIYGSAVNGGPVNAGTVWSYDESVGFKTLFAFDSTNGEAPAGGVSVDAKGNLYGTTYAGGLDGCMGTCGTVWKLDTQRSLTTLFRFDGGRAGYQPVATVLIDKNGDLYGQSRAGYDALSQPTQGTVWKITQ